MVEYRALEGTTGEQHINVDAGVKSLSIPASISNPIVQGRAIIQVNGPPILYTLNGVDPILKSLVQGMNISRHDRLIVTGSELTNLKITKATSKDTQVHVRYERRIN